ncbi:unnamed protein product [Dovyalis caffra]|uniref:Uncharacterized protein n=1 Tax=Dovyalis caffra TaxID=77055 RepID=A0AAV1RZ94_9ROSI|nr:unnamed protein product [Dovyalis caffra]
MTFECGGLVVRGASRDLIYLNLYVVEQYSSISCRELLAFYKMETKEHQVPSTTYKFISITLENLARLQTMNITSSTTLYHRVGVNERYVHNPLRTPKKIHDPDQIA